MRVHEVGQRLVTNQSVIQKKVAFNGVLQSNILKKSLNMAANNGALLAASTCVGLSMFVRPVAIMLTPKSEKKDKQYACMRSVSSAILGLGVMSFISIPISKAVKNIENNPEKYLKKNTIKVLRNGEKTLAKSGNFKFIAQMVKLSSAIIAVPPKAFLTCALIPPLMSTFFKKKNVDKKAENNYNLVKHTGKNVSFKCRYSPLSRLVGRIADIKPLQNMAEKYKNSNMPQYMLSSGDILATAMFIHYTNKNKHIDEDKKKTLNYNSAINTAISVFGGYGVSKLLDKPTEKFIEKFSKANKGDKNLHKYVEGIRVMKPIVILGTLYYAVAPVISTFLAGKIASNNGDKS